MALFDSKCSRCRRAGGKLFLKGEKCFGPKCPLTKRNYAPGQHGPTKKHLKVSGYGKQLKEKQEAKRYYGLRERQFANYVTEASRKSGDTSKFLITYLESRLDNVVFRMGFTASRSAARQLVSHGHIAVNGKKLDIASYRVRIGDEIAIAAKSVGKKAFEGLKERLAKYEAPAWVKIDPATATGKVLNTPTLDNPAFNPKVIIEFYSR